MDDTLPQEDSTTRNDDSENQLRQQEQNADVEQQQQQAKSQHQLEQQQKNSSSEQLQQHDSNEQQPEIHQRQQQQTNPPEALQSSANIGSNILTNLRTNANTNLTNKIDTSIPEELFSNQRWGTTPIRQDTPWELPPSPTQTQPGGAVSALPPQQLVGLGSSGSSLAIPPGISQSGDSFHGQAMAATVNNMGGLVGGPTNMLSSRFEQPWRGSMAPSKPPTLATSASFANHNLMSAAPGAMPKSYLGSSGNGQSAFSMQPGGDFARAPGPSPSILDASAMVQKPFGMAQRASTWSSFGSQAGLNDTDSEWPKTTTSGGLSGGVNSNQSPSNAFDLAHDMEPGKSWHGSNLMKGLEDDPPMNLGQASMSNAFQSAYGFSSASKSPTGGQFESSGIGTWSPVVKGNRSGSMWGGDGDDSGRGEGGRFDDGTAIWGATNTTKVTGGVDWVEKTGDPNSNNDKSRSSAMAGNNQSNYRPQQQQPSSSSTSLLMSSNTSPSSQQNRNQQQNFSKPSSLSHNFDQVQQQSNALSSQANQPNRGLGLSSNVPSKHQQQLTTMVQQIQLAVQAGHLNPQILNQPLAPVTLQLLYQLLQQIRTLHQLQMKFNQPGSNQAGVGVQMTKTKQNILNLQNQIAAQQAMHLKQNQAHNISSRQPTMPNLATGGMGGNIGPTLPPGISQSGDSFRSSTSVGDFHGQAMVNSFGADSMGANGLATSLSHMNLGGTGVMHSRFDQPWRQAPANKHHQSAMASSSSFANHNLMNAAPGGMQKSMLNNSTGNGGPSYVGMQQQQGGEFARAPGPASSMMDNSLNPKPFGMTNRNASTWSAFGNSSSNEPEPEWPKSATTSSGISSNNSSQPPNAFDLVPEFEPGKPWRGSMLMRSVEDDPTMTPGSMARSLAPQRKTIWSDEIL